MKFSYTALNEQNQQLKGVLEADSLELAQEQLHKMSLSILMIDEINDETFKKQTTKQEGQSTGIESYIFQANDPQGKVVNGTIDAKDIQNAYQRLVQEYHFIVTDLHHINANPTEIEVSKEKISAYAAKLSENMAVSHPDETDKKATQEQNVEMHKKVTIEIDTFIITSKKILDGYQNYFTGTFFSELKDTLNQLERIRSSNNLKHITEVAHEVYELASYPDNISSEKFNSDTQYQKILDDLRATALVKKELTISVPAAKISSWFSKLSGHFKEIHKNAASNGKSKVFIKWLADLFDSLHVKFYSNSHNQTIKSAAMDPGLPKIWTTLKSIFSAPNDILRETRKREFKDAIKEYRQLRNDVAEKKRELAAVNKKDFNPFFLELDSFLGWLLFFYIFYFYIVNFSLEKNIGVPTEFILKTLESPLVINITIFLLLAHFVLRMKTNHFRQNFLGSLFLFVFGFTFYMLLINNF